jgi:HK97 family phage major capsid protein
VDSEEFDLLKDLNGQYRGGNPIGNFTYDQPIWGLRRVESEAIEEGSALVGAFRPGATVLERQGVQILTADQHADFFIRNLIVVLAEERLGFAVYYPSAFVDVTIAAWGS